jgi:hypothetical protein
VTTLVTEPFLAEHTVGGVEGASVVVADDPPADVTAVEDVAVVGDPLIPTEYAVAEKVIFFAPSIAHPNAAPAEAPMAHDEPYPSAEAAASRAYTCHSGRRSS